MTNDTNGNVIGKTDGIDTILPFAMNMTLAGSTALNHQQSMNHADRAAGLQYNNNLGNAPEQYT